MIGRSPGQSIRRLLRVTAALAVPAVLAVSSAAIVAEAQPARAVTLSKPAAPTVPGIDISQANGAVDWQAVRTAGYRFAMVGAADGTAQNPSFAGQYSGAKYAGLLRGAYFFAEPSFEPGATHADWFLDQIHYTADGTSLPPMIDVEQNTNLGRCNGVSPSVWISYVHGFVQEVKRRTGQAALIYTNPDTWVSCLGNSRDFAATNSLWVAEWNTAAPSLFGGWTSYTFWQHSDNGSVPGVRGSVDLDLFNGAVNQLQALAPGSESGTPFKVTGVDSAGLAVQSQPHANHVMTFAPAGATLHVSCQTNHGDQVDGRTMNGRAFTTWDRLSDGNWVYDWYLNTPAVGANGYSPGIAPCPGG
ncbi:GH25 family lysozyme [Streptomyces gilvus]|uniref:GH25 family lysozyme n=1 Tax=Streptomyces gilvus TaxID=2920937 RepID=UPI001F0D40AC|nr:GH25 family lysozyme [Streptomyces sp. CME 23]MCH5677886.1 hypothetical protein [Streptomyces sp. CME 23]